MSALERLIKTGLLPGAVVAVLGAAIALGARGYPLGTLQAMGPGFFPFALGILLALIGLALMATTKGESTDYGPRIEARVWLAIVGSLIAFIALGRYLGLVPATFAVVFLSAFADRGNSLRSAALLALAMVVVAVIIFSWALQMQFPLFRWG